MTAETPDIRVAVGEGEAAMIVGVSGPVERRDAILASAAALRGVL